MTDVLLPAAARAKAVPIHATAPDGLSMLSAMLEARAAAWVAATGFSAKAGAVLLVPEGEGGIGSVFFGLGPADAPDRSPLLAGKLATTLPAGTYHLGEGFDDPALACLAFALGAYRFTRYRADASEAPRLVVPDGVDLAAVNRLVAGVTLARDLINTAANDMGPADLAAAAQRARDAPWRERFRRPRATRCSTGISR